MKRERFPAWVVPMAATLTQERFHAPEWVFERKVDGIRMLAFKQGDDVKLYSRNRLLQDYPSVAAAISVLPYHDLILDGEAAWDSTSRIAYHAFDLLWLEGRSLMSLPLDSRRDALHKLTLRPPLAHVAEVGGKKPWEHACREGWEGVIAKRRDSLYEHRRSTNWLKMKCEMSQELVVGGFTDPQGARVGLGALLVGYFHNRELVFAGKIGTGFTGKLLVELRTRLDKLEIAKPPFTQGSGLPRRAHWVKPDVVVQVGFSEWTVHGKLRHPRLIGIRQDKMPHECVREG
jgi:bifunctional non-homologous end joining protein LigD